MEIGKFSCVIVTCIVFAMFFQWCLSSGSGKSSVKASSPETNSEELAQLDKQIATTKSQIEGYEQFQRDQLREAVVNAHEHDRSRGWVKLDGNSTYEETSDRAYANAAATEKEIARLNKKLKQLESQKSQLTNQSSGCFLPGTLVKMEDGSLKVSVKAPADKGKANKELIDMLSKEFDVAKDKIKIISGAGTRKKLIKIIK